MTHPHILHMITPLKHVSPFDVNMALDAGYGHAVPYTDVELNEVTGLIQDSIFSRGPQGAKRTGAFIGGRDAILALDMLEAARQAMVPPFEISVFADPAGSFTTAAAMVACLERQLARMDAGGLSGKEIVVFGATGIVGFASAVIAGQEGARVVMAGYDGEKRVKARSEEAKERFGVDLEYADASSEFLVSDLVRGAEVALCAGRAGTQILSREQIAGADSLRVVADVNAVPPAGAEGVEVMDDGKPIEGSNAVGIGALAIGNVKYRVEQRMFKTMLEAEKPVYLDFTDAFRAARDIAAD